FVYDARPHCDGEIFKEVQVSFHWRIKLSIVKQFSHNLLFKTFLLLMEIHLHRSEARRCCLLSFNQNLIVEKSKCSAELIPFHGVSEFHVGQKQTNHTGERSDGPQDFQKQLKTHATFLDEIWMIQ